jgi:N-acetylmuramoyl-L-alanine amidase
MKLLRIALLSLICLLLLAACAPAQKGGVTSAPTVAAPVTASPSPTAAPTPTPTPRPPLAGRTIGIDPGHQAKADSAREPIAPGSKTLKKKVSSGTRGRFSGVYEYEVVLEIGLLVRNKLESLGATVVMTRQTNDVNISNIARAQLFNEARTDYALRLHCNGSKDPDINGAFILIPNENPFEDDCCRAAELLLENFCEATGAENLGIVTRSDQTGFNWCKRMIINIEMGHMTNETEDLLLTSAAYQEKMATGLVNGILAYFGER